MTSRMQEPQAAAGSVAAPSVITIDRTSPVPLYFQLAQHFEAAIRSGALKVGSRLDNEVQLAERLGLSRPTVRAAFQYLSNKGLVVRKRGAGTLVANERIDRDVELTSLYDDLAAAGRSPGTKVIRNEVTHATDAVAAALQLPEPAMVVSLERIRLADGEPIALMHNFLPTGLVHLSIDMLEQHGLYELLRASGIRLGSATQRMCAKNASAPEARILHENRGAAALPSDDVARDPVQPGHLRAPAGAIGVGRADDREEHLGCQVGHGVRVRYAAGHETRDSGHVLAVEGRKRIRVTADPGNGPRPLVAGLVPVLRRRHVHAPLAAVHSPLLGESGSRRYNPAAGQAGHEACRALRRQAGLES